MAVFVFDAGLYVEMYDDVDCLLTTLVQESSTHYGTKLWQNGTEGNKQYVGSAFKNGPVGDGK